MRLQGQKAMITGAASGIGREVARRFAREGATVILADVDAAGLRQACEEIGDAACACVSDVTREADWLAAMAEHRLRHGRLDILVNCAGSESGAGAQDPEHLLIEEWRRVQAVNVEGVALGCKHAIALMRSGGGGAIVNVASVAGCVATPSLAAYGASKAAVIQLTRSVAAHCGRSGYRIRCNCVLPGVVVTPMVERFWERLQREQNLSATEARQGFMSRMVLGSFQQASDIAAAVLFLASAEAAQITGVALPVDGGFLLHDR